MDKSPLELYCDSMDKKYPELSYREIYYNIALKVDRKYFTNLFIEDIEYRANHQRNILLSIEAQQGAGKSLTGIGLGRIIGNKFGVSFEVERDLFANPEELDSALRKTDMRRRTFLYDEQPARQVGIGSVATALSLKDYADLMRYSQNNIIYSSPDLREHSHYFVLKQIDFDPPRIKNIVCRDCEKYSQCMKDYYETMCDIPFYEREGYPIQFNFMLESLRLADKMFIPRGVLSIPMVSPELAIRYDKIKQVNMKKFRKYENNAFNELDNEIEEFITEYKNRLITERELKTGEVKKKIAGKKLIYYYFIRHFTSGRFTTGQAEILIEGIKARLEEIKNEEE